MPGKIKRIPKNSIGIILKFDTDEQKSKLLKSPKFQLYQAKIMNITIEAGGNCEYFTDS